MCLKPLEGKPSSHGTRGYSCNKNAPWKGCGRIRISADPLEEDVAVKVLARFATKDAVAQLAGLVQTSARTGSALAVEIGELEAKLAELGTDYAAGRIGRIAFHAAEAESERLLNELRRQAKRVIHLPTIKTLVTPDDLAAWWIDGSTIIERHDLVRTVLSEVRIRPSRRRGFRGFDAERVEYHWADEAPAAAVGRWTAAT